MALQMLRFMALVVVVVEWNQGAVGFVRGFQPGGTAGWSRRTSTTTLRPQAQQAQQRPPPLSSSECWSERFTTQITTPSRVVVLALSSSSSSIESTRRQSRRSVDRVTSSTTTTTTPAIGGAEFFGGKKEKEEFYDPQAEATAVLRADQDTSSGESSNNGAWDRFADRSAFSDDTVAGLVRHLQFQVNQVLYDDSEVEPAVEKGGVQYATANKLVWKTPFDSLYLQNQKQAQTTTLNPLEALQCALNDFERVDVALTAGRPLPNDNTDNNNQRLSVELHWEVSLAWSEFAWEPRVLLIGSSHLQLERLQPDSSWTIVQQDDFLFGGHDHDKNNNNKNNDQVSLLRTQYLAPQLVPRFWDLYHIGMTPSAEVQPHVTVQKRRGYEIWDWPGRWYVTPIVVDTSMDRTVQLAQVLPSHAFGVSALSTVGPTQERFVPTSPLELQIRSNNNNKATNGMLLQWQIPLSVELQSQLVWPPATSQDDDDDEDEPDTTAKEPSSSSTTTTMEPECRYTWVGPRRVAVVPFGGTGPQDEGIPAARQALYQAVIQEGQYQPKLTTATSTGTGRPQFTFWNQAFKGCFTANGLGMAVYEWRPTALPWLAQNHYVGLELQVPEP